MELIEMINARKLEMVKESQTAERNKEILIAQLNQVNMQILELDVELRVLDKWEAKLTPKEAK